MTATKILIMFSNRLIFIFQINPLQNYEKTMALLKLLGLHIFLLLDILLNINLSINYLYKTIDDFYLKDALNK